MTKIKSTEKKNSTYKIISNTRLNIFCRDLKELKKELKKIENRRNK